MHRATLLSVSLMVLCGACTTRISADAAPPSTSGAPPATAVPVTTVDPAVQCISTDPGWRPISVHRAVNCPDGTQVTVSGVEIDEPDGTKMLCDSNIVTDDCLTIDGVAPAGLPPGVSSETVYTGVVTGHRLVLPMRPLTETGVSRP